MKKEHRILVTPYCANDCFVCCFSGEYTLSMQHFPEGAAENLLKSFSKEKIGITGKDPLRNTQFLEQTIKQHKGKKSIILNPLSFLTLEHKKPGRHITADDALKSIENLERFGLSEQASYLIRLLNYYDRINVSNGRLQAPNPEAAVWANFYFENVKPYLSGKVTYRPLQDRFIVACVGSYRKEGMPANVRVSKRNTCGEPGYQMSIFNNELRLHACCSVGLSDHISSYYTGIKTEDMENSQPRELYGEIKNAHKKYRKTGLHNLLSPNFFFKSRGKIEERFLTLYRWTNDFLKENNGEQVTYVRTNRISPSPCETCHTMALYLKRAGIAPGDYQEYIEDRFRTEFK